jgi:translocation and assembly module TamB
VEVAATAGAGGVEVARLEAAAPGASLTGHLRWREGGAALGELALEASDLDVLERNLAAVLGRPLPDLEGAGRAAISLSGTTRAPALAARIDAARLGVGRVRAEGARLRVEAAGPAEAASGHVQGALARADVGGLELRGVALDAALGEEEASLSVTALVPSLGTDLVRVLLRGRFADGRRAFDLADAVVAWPGTRFTLQRPARLDLAGPSVDRLALAADAQRIEVAGGVRKGGEVEGRVQLAGIDLARLPAGLAPPGAALAGLLALDASVGGTREAPRVAATLGITGASAFEVGGLQLLGDLGWDAGEGRLEADLGLVRARGGSVDLSLDVPVPLGSARGYQELRVELQGRAVPLDELVWLAGSYALVSGDLDVTARLTGSVAAPVFHGIAALRAGTFDDLEDLSADAAVDAPGERLKVRASGAIAGAPAFAAEGELALDTGRLLARPGEALAAARRGPLTLAVDLPGVALALLSGKLGLPGDLAGRVEGAAALGGSLEAPRGTARASVSGGAGWGVRAADARLDVALAPERTGASLDLRLAGSPAARLDGSVDLPVERFPDAAALAAAPARVDLSVARSDLGAWGAENLSLKGTVEGKGTLRGSLGRPQVELSLAADGAVVEGRPLGAVALEARHDGARTAAGVDLRPPAGGALRADAALDRPLGLGAGAGPLLEAPGEARVRADRLDLGFLPALAPGLVRAASGSATVDLAASGTLGDPRVRGTLRVAGGRLAVAELGDWRDAAIEASLDGDALELRRFDVRKGTGRLSLRGSLRGLARPGEPAQVEAAIEADDFGVERAGMEFARFDVKAEARGEATRGGLTLGVVVPQGEVKLPKRIPRTLQETGTRKDITVGRPKPQRAPRSAHAPAPSAAGPAAAPREPFRTVIHLAAPRRLRVRADLPRIDVELKADAILAFAGGRQEANGWVQVIRGQVEPIGGRNFVLERGKVTFGGGPIAAGALDVAARYDAPAAVVHATVGGTLGKPQLQLRSDPPLEEAQIAMLVATGRTEVKAGTEGVNTLAAGDAGLAAAGALAMGAFKDLLADKLPIDSFSLDATALNTGKYLTDRIYVGYVRRFDAKPEKGENPDEVRVEYELAPGWHVETRYGSGQAGGASIVWTRSY